MNTINNLSPTETFTNLNWELITLTSDKMELLNKLVKNTNESKEIFLKEILNEETTWEDLEDYNYILERKQDPNLKFISNEEATIYLRNLSLNKQSHELQI